ncbi:Choline transport protein [Fusarium odoratissimum]|uniref:Choline transport protein n=3 Tax=Fusarium oxysporum species complex TaxID=171631 RepID=N1S6R7_FUSC4|nr:Choline transport protein [Fusarium odoratissimum]
MEVNSAASAAAEGDIASYTEGDVDRLQSMGYVQTLERKFSLFGLIGICFSLTNSWWCVSAALVTGLGSGGSALLLYGTTLLFIVSLAIAVSLGELVSAYPNATGQSFWVRELAPASIARQASYTTGWLIWVGSVFACTSVASAMGSALVGTYALTHPDFVPQTWHVFVAFQVFNMFVFAFNCYGPILPKLGQVFLLVSLASFGAILVTVPAVADKHQPATFVFATFTNLTGWSNNFMAFAVGLINANWGFSCLDSAVHLAEETAHPERVIPLVIVAVVVIGFVTSFCFLIAMLFSIQSIEKFLEAAVPIIELFSQVCPATAGAVVLESLIIATGVGCLMGCQTWSSRLLWSFARDGGVPFHSRLEMVDSRLDVPLAAHMTNTALVAIVGCIYMASTTAFNAMIIACIVFPNLSYAVPILSLLYHGRTNLIHGPFWLGRLGLVCNIVALLWIIFTLVFYSFPAVMPVSTGNMNYVCAIYGLVGIIISIDWFSRGKKVYRSAMNAEGEAAAMTN